MKTSDAIKRAGGNTKLAIILGITPGAISQWGDDVPDGRMWQLKVIRPTWFRESPKQAKAHAQRADAATNSVAVEVV